MRDILGVSLAVKLQMEKAGLLATEELDGISCFQDDLKVVHCMSPPTLIISPSCAGSC